MIKGCNKRVIVMKDTGNSMIEEAFFILKPGSDRGHVSQDDILKHANTLLLKSAYNEKFSGMSMNVSDKEKKKGDFASFWSGVVIGALVAASIVLAL